MDCITQKEDIDFVLRSLFSTKVSYYRFLSHYLSIIVSDLFEDFDWKWFYERRGVMAEEFTVGDMFTLIDKVRTDMEDRTLSIFGLMLCLDYADDDPNVRLLQGISYKSLLEAYGERIPKGLDGNKTIGELYFDGFAKVSIVPFVERLEDNEERTAFYEEMSLSFIPLMSRIKAKLYPEDPIKKAISITWRMKFNA